MSLLLVNGRAAPRALALRRKAPLGASKMELFWCRARGLSTQRTSAEMSDAQRRSYEFYERKRMESPMYRFRVWWNRNKKKAKANEDTQDLNVQLAWYATAIVVGVVGATYASVPLYKVFCQTTGFGGTTQRVQVGDAEPPTWIDVAIAMLY